LTAVGVFQGRPTDELGIGLAYARNGSHYMSAQRMQGLSVTNAETAIELTYLIQVNSWLALQPDLQYVIRPNTTTAIPNAWAFQIRIEMSF
jgi:porin